MDENIAKGADRMHEVVNTMLDVTRIDSEALKISPAPIPLKRIFKDLSVVFVKPPQNATLNW